MLRHARVLGLALVALSSIPTVAARAQDTAGELPEPPGSADVSPATSDPWAGWTDQQRSGFALAWIPCVFLGAPMYVVSAVAVSSTPVSPCRSRDCGTWAGVAAIPAAGPWIRLFDPSLRNFFLPVAFAITNTVMLTALISGICMLAYLFENGSRARRAPVRAGPGTLSIVF